jgi:hypothetical protein
VISASTELPTDRCWFWCGSVRITPNIKTLLALKTPKDCFPPFNAYPIPIYEQESLGHKYETRIEHYLWAKHRPNDPIPSRLEYPCTPFMARHWHPEGPRVRCPCINPFHVIPRGTPMKSARRKVAEPRAARELHTPAPTITLAEGRQLFPGLFKPRP